MHRWYQKYGHRSAVAFEVVFGGALSCLIVIRLALIAPFPSAFWFAAVNIITRPDFKDSQLLAAVEAVLHFLRHGSNLLFDTHINQEYHCYDQRDLRIGIYPLRGPLG